MNCQCDQFQFPDLKDIPAGLSRLPRQIGTFDEFRRAMLHAISVAPNDSADVASPWSDRLLIEPDGDALKQNLAMLRAWRGRHPHEYGMMLIEMWAYVCDLTSFYDEVLADESYLGTAGRRPSLRKLVDLLGYLPKPALGALADLAVFADGRQPVTLPAGTAFRSGAFGGNPPQVFELSAQAVIDPSLNKWAAQPVLPITAINSFHDFLLCQPGTVSVKQGDVVLLKIGTARNARRVTGVRAVIGIDGNHYQRVEFDRQFEVPLHTDLSIARMLTPTATAVQWKIPGVAVIGRDNTKGAYLLLDTIYRRIRVGQDVVLEYPPQRTGALKTGALQVLRVNSTEDSSQPSGSGTTISYIPTPGAAAVSAQVVTNTTSSKLFLHEWIDQAIWDESPNILVHWDFRDGGTVTAEARTEVLTTDQLIFPTATIQPSAISISSATYQIEDKNLEGLTLQGVLRAADGHFSHNNIDWPDKTRLIPPLSLFGNILSVSRGETVKGEVLGTGDASIANQNFTLKKKPLTYLPDDTPKGYATTLQVWVDGVLWNEVENFYQQDKDAEVYIVRQDDDQQSIVTFGDGERGKRLNSNSRVTASYRYGAGLAMPPAGSITQIAKSVKGLKSVRSPIGPYKGADAEDGSSLRNNAPHTALLFERAISLADLETAVLQDPSVRVVASEWKWDMDRQSPTAHLWYIENNVTAKVARDIQTRLRGMTQPGTPITVTSATKLSATLRVNITTDPRRDPNAVGDLVHSALIDAASGMLIPEQLGIGKPLYRSNVFETVLAVQGVLSIESLTINAPNASMIFPAAPNASAPNAVQTPCVACCKATDYAIPQAAGSYFDFSETNAVTVIPTSA